MMDEYVLLAQQYANWDDPESSIAEWKVGTFEQIAYWLEKWEAEGYACSVRRCGNPLNTEFIKARIEKVASA
jgi:hypothetical protein